MGRVRCSICSQSTGDESGYCDLCGAELPHVDAGEALLQARARRDLEESRVKEARKPKGKANPDAETLFAVKQLTGFTSVLIDWNTMTRWEMTGGSGHICYHAGEIGGTKLDRAQRGRARPWKIEVRAIDGSPYGRLDFTLVREWGFLAPAPVEVFDGNGEPLGSVRPRWFSLGKRYDLVDAGGTTRARVVGPMFSPWTFEIRVDREVRGRISKEWGGIERELFTSADMFGMELDPSWDRPMRGLAFAALFLIDFLHFEGNRAGLVAAVDLATGPD